jgi:cation diffusion facilitator CzcD-associated flavoprotein CzcO
MTDIVIIGCGFAGIGMAVALKRAGFERFTLLESASDVGGTWRDNIYPGVAVDIPSFTYSFSFEQRADWSRLFAPGHELKRYAADCVRKYDLHRHIRFDTRVSEIRLLGPSRWQLTTTTGAVLHANYVISATGLLTQPKLPALPDLERFAGPVVHTARWQPELELHDKRVAIIGTGATSVQLVPAIADQVRQLSVFQRTPIWVLPKLDAPVPRLVQKLLRHVPGLQSAARAGTTSGTEVVMVLAIVYHRQFPFLVREIERLCRLHLARQVQDRALRARLTPDYGFGCKRPSFSNTYFSSFNKPNVSLETQGIREVLPHGIVTGDGREIPLDVLLMATGFQTYEKGNLPTFAVHGRDGVELAAFWEEHRYQAYQGAAIPSFPNFFMMIGPYAATGSSWFSMIENQAAHILRCMRKARQLGATCIEVKPEPHARYFAEIQQRQTNTVFFNNQCGSSHSYYFDKHGDALFYRPASGAEAYLQSRLSPLSHYAFS